MIGQASADDEALLVGKSRAGSREAFEELVRRTGRLVFARIYLETADPHLSEDLTQETFLTAFRRVRGWLRPIEIASGLVLVAVGLLIFTNYFAVLAAYLNRWLLPLFPFIAENI